MSTINVYVISPDTRSERRYDLHLTVEQLKRKLEPVTGISADSQRITVHEQGTEDDDRAVVLATLDEDSKPLGYYSIRDWQVLKVVDTNPSTAPLAGQFTDVSQVQKFEISQEEYAARRATLLAYKQAHKIGRFAPPSAKDTEESQELPVNIPLDSRCEVETGDSGLRKRGKVCFVGTTQFAKGIWVGIEYDEPLGKNDGSVQGVRYFTCRPSYGGFIRPELVHIGDFPVEELDIEEEI